MGFKKTTSRGFKIYGKFTDTKDSKIRVQESSTAEEPCIWIFAENNPDIFKDPSPHLNAQQAKKLIHILQKFIKE